MQPTLLASWLKLFNNNIKESAFVWNEMQEGLSCHIALRTHAAVVFVFTCCHTNSHSLPFQPSWRLISCPSGHRPSPTSRARAIPGEFQPYYWWKQVRERNKRVIKWSDRGEVAKFWCFIIKCGDGGDPSKHKSAPLCSSASVAVDDQCLVRNNATAPQQQPTAIMNYQPAAAAGLGAARSVIMFSLNDMIPDSIMC